MPDTIASLIDDLRQLHLLEAGHLDELTQTLQVRFPEPRALARELVRRGWLTPHQVNQLFCGRGQELLLGSYVLVEKLGEGGMGQVFKAKNWKLGRTVALKLIRKERLANADAVRRFHREIRAAAQLDHLNIVHAHDADEANGIHFFVLDYVAGADLAEVVKKRGPLPMALACDCVRQAALGLQHAHEHGLVHRDVKPSNLLLSAPGGVVKLLDLGMARLCHVEVDGEMSSATTLEGAIVGTPDFMAPEQALDAHTADIRADLYGLGCTLYFLLTGTVPFPGGSLGQKIARHQMLEPVPVQQRRPEVPATVAAVVHKLMAKRPEDRYQTPLELATALAALAAGPPVPVPADTGSPALADVGPSLTSVETIGHAARQAFDFQPTEDTVEGLLQKQRRQRAARQLVRRVALAGGVVLLALAGMLLAWLPRTGRPGPAAGPNDKPEATAPWEPGPAEDVLPGLVARPAVLPGIKRWQVETNTIRFDLHSVSWSPDGKHIAYRGAGGVWVYNAASLQLVRWLACQPAWGHHLAWSPDGNWLACGCEDKTVRLWDKDGRPGPVLRGHTSSVPSLAWSPDGKRLASGGYWGDSTVRLWGVDGKPGPILKHETWISSLAWSPDGKVLATADHAARKIRLWDPTEGSQITALEQLPQGVGTLAWSPDGKYLASSGGDYAKEKVGGWIWDVAERKPKVTLQAFGSWINWLGWSSDGKLASATQDGYVALFEPRNGKILFYTPQTISLGSASWSPDGRQIADSAGRILNVVEEGRRLALLHDRRDGTKLNGVAWSPDGKQLALASDDRTVRLWSANGRPRAVLKGHEKEVLAVAWSPDSKQLASASNDRTIRLWSENGIAGAILKDHEGEVGAVAWGPDGKQLASASADRTVRLWGAGGTRGPVLRGHEEGVWSIAWRPDGKQLTSGSRDLTIRFWDATGTPGAVLQAGHVGRITSITWSPDGQRLATSSGWGDPFVRLWDADGTPGPVLKGHGSSVNSVAWSPDGKRLASASKDRTVRLWSKDGTPGPVLGGHESAVQSVAWSPDSRRLVSVGWDGTIRVADAGGEPEWTAVLLHDGQAAAFSAAGELLHGDPEVIEKELVYLVEQADGRIEALKPSEFLKRFAGAGQAPR